MDRADAPVRLHDSGSHVTADVRLIGAGPVAAQKMDDYAVYPGSYGSNATVVRRALPDGMEDFIKFNAAPPRNEVAYELSLGEGLDGLRLVANTLELLDASGAPRLRAAPAYLVGADGTRTTVRNDVLGSRDLAAGPHVGVEILRSVLGERDMIPLPLSRSEANARGRLV